MSGYPKRLHFFVLAFVMGAIFGTSILSTSSAQAAVNDFDEEAPMTVAAGAPDKPGHRNYAGGRDEQNLEVQAGLPVPSRALEGATVLAAPKSEEEAAHD